jgi:hypothetical protein
MSSTLSWAPYTVQAEPSLPYYLKTVLVKRYGDSLDGVHMASEDISYLAGLRDAEVKGADELISAIEKHGEISLRETI